MYLYLYCFETKLHVNIFIYFSLPLRMLGQELALCQTLGVQHRLSQILSKLITQDILMFLRNNQINHIKQSHLSGDTGSWGWLTNSKNWDMFIWIHGGRPTGNLGKLKLKIGWLEISRTMLKSGGISCWIIVILSHLRLRIKPKNNTFKIKPGSLLRRYHAGMLVATHSKLNQKTTQKHKICRNWRARKKP